MRFAHFEFDPAHSRLGEGPQSEVFKAVDTQLGRTVALKILRPHVEFDPSAKERFEREAKHTSHLAHPNIATVYEYGQDRGTSYIAMEYLEGKTLDKVIADHTLGYEEGLRLALQVTAALELVHERGLIHRDLKPANIMVMGDGTVRLLDFGICRSTGESNITQDGMLVGTVLYMAPEQVLGEELDVRTDIFALGSVFYHAFTGQLPFPGKSFPEVCLAILEAEPRPPSELRSGFPKELEAFLLRALKRDPNERFPRGGVAHGALLAVADGLRLASADATSASVRGRFVIPPFSLAKNDEHDQLFAGGVVKDLSRELERSTQLHVSLEEPLDALHEAYLLRASLDLQGERAVLDYRIEHALPQNDKLEGERNGNGASQGNGNTAPIWTETIEHEDEDEWGLQAKLVGSLARSIRRNLAEYRVSPPDLVRGNPEQALALAGRAHAILHRGTTRHLMGAISLFRRALEEDKACALAHAGMAEALVRKFLDWDGDATFLQEARESAALALAQDPSCAEAHTSLGFASYVSGNTTEAQREFRLAIQLDHNEWLAHRLLGALLGRLGNYEGASPLLRRAIGLHPVHIGSYDHLYGVLSRLDHYEEAIQIADRGISTARAHLEQVPDDQEARLHLALLLARVEWVDDARTELAKAREIAPKDGYTSYHAATVHALLGESEAALRCLKEAQDRGYYLRSEILRNSDLDLLRGTPEFTALIK